MKLCSFTFMHSKVIGTSISANPYQVHRPSAHTHIRKTILRFSRALGEHSSCRFKDPKGISLLPIDNAEDVALFYRS